MFTNIGLISLKLSEEITLIKQTIVIPNFGEATLFIPKNIVFSDCIESKTLGFAFRIGSHYENNVYCFANLTISSGFLWLNFVATISVTVS